MKPLIIILLLLVFTFWIGDIQAQCAMCKEIVNSGAEKGSTVAKGLNTGILYLLVLPLLAVGTVSVAFWKRWKATQK